MSRSHFYLLSLFSTGVHELERQNKITKQILEAFIQKKLGLRNNSYRAPSLLDILPMPTPSMVTARQPDPEPFDPEEDLQDQENDETQDNEESQDSGETQEYNDSDSLQSVESEQIDSIYNTGRYSY